MHLHQPVNLPKSTATNIGADGNHLDDVEVAQEEFKVGSTSTELKEKLNTHSNNDDLEHHDH